MAEKSAPARNAAAVLQSLTPVSGLRPCQDYARASGGPWGPTGAHGGPKRPQNGQKSGFLGPLGPPQGPRCAAGWREAQFTLVLPQRGIAIFGVGVSGCGDGSGFRLYAYLPAPGARRPPPAARRPPPGARRPPAHLACVKSKTGFRSTLGAGDAGAVFFFQKSEISFMPGHGS